VQWAIYHDGEGGTRIWPCSADGNWKDKVIVSDTYAHPQAEAAEPEIGRTPEANSSSSSRGQPRHRAQLPRPVRKGKGHERRRCDHHRFPSRVGRPPVPAVLSS
jgi:hypothetical protein